MVVECEVGLDWELLNGVLSSFFVIASRKRVLGVFIPEKPGLTRDGSGLSYPFLLAR